MKIIQKLSAVNSAVDRWIMAPAPNAAGRMGLFRIIYALFYLWHLSAHFLANISGVPAVHTRPNLLLILVKHPIGDVGLRSPLFYQSLESVLVAALIILLFGYKTRLATLVVLVVGCIIESIYISIDFERAVVILAFFIPFFMSLNNDWGQTYSLDAALAKRSGIVVEPSDSHWRHFVAARSILVVMSALFVLSAFFKVFFGGTWLTHSDLMSNLVLNKSVEAALLGFPANPLAPFMAQTPLIHHSLRIFTLIFEGLFFLTLVNRHLRGLILSLALVFHAVNALWLAVSFTPVMIAYGLFIDWQAASTVLGLEKIHFQKYLPPRWTVFTLLACASLIGMLWNSSLDIRRIFNLWGAVDGRTIWIPVLPLALIWFFTVLFTGFKQLLKRQEQPKKLLR